MTNFRLKFIQTDEFATLKSNFIAGGTVRLGNSFNFLINTLTKEIIMSFRVTFECDEKEFIILKASCGFIIKPEDFDGFKKPELSKIEIPIDFMSHLASITTGTARGILHAKLEATEFSKYMLPMLDLTNIIKSNVIVDLPSTEPNLK